MNCDDVRNALEEFADGELEGAREREIRSHVEGCAACAGELRQLERLEALLRRASPMPAPRPGFADDVIRKAPRLERRPGSMIPLGLAAAVLFTLAGIQLFTTGSYSLERALTDVHSADPGARDRGVAWLSDALQDPSLERQQAAAISIASLRDEALRDRILSRQAEPAGSWELGTIGSDVSDIELVGHAVGLVRSDKTAREGLQILAKLDQRGLNREAHHEMIRQARELLSTGQEAEWNAGFRILDRLNLLEADVIEFIDVPELGPRALDFLRRRSGQDFGTDKAAWRRWFESRRG